MYYIVLIGHKFTKKGLDVCSYVCDLVLSCASHSESSTQRIRVVHHPLHVYLLVAVRTRLLLTHNAPAADTELVESRGRSLVKV